MAKKYPKHMEHAQETERSRVENCQYPPRIEPEGMDEAKTYTDVYNIPHEAPKR